MRDGLLALLGVVAASGCSYDWAVGSPGAADASKDVVPEADAGPPDATMDGSADASSDVSVDTAVVDAFEAATLLTCTMAQEAPVAQARTAALVCTGVTPNPCTVTVTDECGCPVVVAADNQADANYVAAIKQLKMTCIPSCPSGCGTAPPMGVCVLSDAGSGALACYQ
jgi:hypothetical protein